MKKLFAVLFCSLVMSGAAFADEPSYEIDPVATANAPWKVEQTILQVPEYAIYGDVYCLFDPSNKFCTTFPAHRIFLGVTTDGYYLVQDVYDDSGTPASLPYKVIGQRGAFSIFPLAHGEYKSWYPNGIQMVECVFNNGETLKPCVGWYETGEGVSQLANIKNGVVVGNMIIFYKNGNIFLDAHHDESGKLLRATMSDQDGLVITQFP